MTNGTGGNIIGQDPNLGSLTGAPAYFPLLSGSPAIDAGTNTGCPATDQRGLTRPQGAHCDIGSYEVEIHTINASINVTIGGNLQGNYELSSGEEKHGYYNLSGGPVVIRSNDGAKIIASLLQLRRQDVTGGWTGITQLMGVQEELIGTTYVFPRYHGTDPTKYQTIQIANYDTTDANVTVTIAGTPYGPYLVEPGSTFSFLNTSINAGPVVVSSDGPMIIASLYELQRQASSGKWTGQTQMMGIPFAQLSGTYVFPRYNNTLSDLDATLIFAVP